jgi:hypothetical protein
MPSYQVECAVGEEIGADVEVAGVAGAEGDSLCREAVLRYVGVGGREDGALGGVEGAWWWRVVVGVVCAASHADGGLS